MCGFVGILERGGASFAEEHLLKEMRDSILHRGPDDAGFHKDGPLGIGFRRLSVIDVPGGHQPMTDKHSGVSIVFNGEIYNYKDLRNELKSLGHQFNTASDTEVLLRSFIQWGEDCLLRLRGMFAFAAWAPKTQTLLLARDHLGIKPLYWSNIGEQFVFSSEVKAFFHHPLFEKAANLDGISSYLTFRQATWDITFFEGVQKLLPGHFMKVSRTQIVQQPYWQLGRPELQHGRSEKAWLDDAESLLETAVKRCLVSDVPIGAYLSGGLDSSIMVALMARNMKEPPKTFSIGYGVSGYDEERYARDVAQALGTDHIHLVLGRNDFADGLVPLIKQCDAPVSIPQMVAVLALSKEIRRHVKVALSGDGADELFGGYGRVMRSGFDWKKIEFLRRMSGGAVAGLSSFGRDPMGPLSNLDCTNQLEHFYRMYHWMPFDEKLSLFSDETLARLNNDRKVKSVFEDAFATVNGADPHDKIFHVFQKLHLGCILDKVDTIGMLASLEGRVPFADPDLVQRFVNMPHKYKLHWNSRLSQLRGLYTSAFKASENLDQSKFVLRKLGNKLLPDHIVSRKKMGFPAPLDLWLQSGMLDQAREILLDPKCTRRNLFNRQKIEAFLSDPQHLDYDFYGKKVWMLMNVELWLSHVVDEPRSSAMGAQGWSPSAHTSALAS